MRRNIVLLVLLGVMAASALALAGDSSSAGRACPPDCQDCCSGCGVTSCPISG